jgi:hypothetical protein
VHAYTSARRPDADADAERSGLEDYDALFAWARL